ncbi:hypothetical protein ASU31_15140 [Pedobacter ginsenosidimutans]|uniref:DUF4241 domain-containing protein n=1 Tax=Pedobacter ginsenosidimutans TaxID=687842 RepID=A0A0T5VNT3_9SPHI|nr:DUF4241 domain-containing protein [Pedobacter ginsenosidimutans]KRT15359.1 hypothetical protein ASU31_15140 [Pedobacter ginsenosidimutans]
MIPSNEWLKIWNEKRNLLACPNNLNDYFEETSVAGKKIDHLELGSVSIPTGEILVRDPLVYVQKDAEPYLIKVPRGEFPVTAAVVVPDGEDCARYAAVKVQFTAYDAIHFEEALIGTEDLVDFNEGEFFGFNVDAGLACVLDKETLKHFCSFQDKFNKENPGKNLYDDYFAALFASNYAENPDYQREGGDWINWKIPGTDYHIPFFQSGFGDGTYPVYYGFDIDGNICALVIQFIDIELAYGEEE